MLCLISKVTMSEYGSMVPTPLFEGQKVVVICVLEGHANGWASSTAPLACENFDWNAVGLSNEPSRVSISASRVGASSFNAQVH